MQAFVGSGGHRISKHVALSLAVQTALFAGVAQALTITGYSSTVNDRFVSGFPTSPVANTDASFIAKDYDLSGVAWSTTGYYNGHYKGLGLLTPQHFLTAQHYEYTTELTAGVRILGTDAAVTSQAAGAISNLGLGVVLTNRGFTNPDLAVGKLTAPITPQKLNRLAVLDLHSTSGADALGNYSALPLLLTGRSSTTTGSPRIGTTNLAGFSIFASDPNQLTVLTTRTAVQMEVGDSGSPLLHGWTNPNGGKEVTVLGLNSAITNDNVYNVHSFLASTAGMSAANAVTTPDGFAVRIAGDVSNTWVGSSSTSISNNGAWGAPAPSDKYVLFNGATAGSGRVVSVNSNHNLRGLYFKSTGSASDGFTVSGGSTLTVGRGGITNYDADRQTITAPLALGDHQYWDVGSGGVTAGAINTNGKLLEIAGAGTAIITGNVSGSGAVALSGTRLQMSGTSAYSGVTWVHSGTLDVSGSIASSSSVRLAAGTRLEGRGAVSTIQGAGSVDPGNSPGILTASAVNPSGGLDFNFEFTQTGSPVYGNAAASGNDVLRVTGASAFTQVLAAGNVIGIYLNVPSLSNNDVFRGGFYLDQDTDFIDQIQNATYAIYLKDPGGAATYNGVTYSLYAGPLDIDVSTVLSAANFGAGTINGGVMQLNVVPEPVSGALLLPLAMLLRRRRC